MPNIARASYACLSLLSAALLSGGAFAHARQEVAPIKGYKCMALALTDQELMNPNFAVPIRSQPADTAPVGTTAAPTVFVAQPADFSNGYLRVLQMTGKTGWIKADVVKPWHALNGGSGKCIPTMMSDGRPGIAVH